LFSSMTHAWLSRFMMGKGHSPTIPAAVSPLGGKGRCGCFNNSASF
jgi:hypothetical protein